MKNFFTLVISLVKQLFTQFVVITSYTTKSVIELVGYFKAYPHIGIAKVAMVLAVVKVFLSAVSVCSFLTSLAVALILIGYFIAVYNHIKVPFYLSTFILLVTILSVAISNLPREYLFQANFCLQIISAFVLDALIVVLVQNKK